MYLGEKDFIDVGDYRTYHMNDQNQYYDKEMTKHKLTMTNRVRVHMRRSTFDHPKAVSILNYSGTFKTACDSSWISEEASMWHPHPFLKKPAVLLIMATAQLGNENCNILWKSIAVIMQRHAVPSIDAYDKRRDLKISDCPKLLHIGCENASTVVSSSIMD